MDYTTPTTLYVPGGGWEPRQDLPNQPNPSFGGERTDIGRTGLQRKGRLPYIVRE